MKIKLPFLLEKHLADKFAMFYIHLQMDIKDKNGKILSSKKQMCHSLTENFLAYMYGNLGGFVPPVSYGFTAPHTNNNSSFRITGAEWANSSGIFNCSGIANDGLNGIVVGTGAVAPTPTTRNLTALITHGVGAGQLSYNAQGSTAGVSVSGQNTNLILYRTFVNNSGGAIIVSEVGLYGGSSVSPAIYLFLMDVLAPVQTVNPLQTLTISITFRTTT